MTTATKELSVPDKKRDLIAGFLVFLIALPLCMGIALASGFPPVAGIITAIVGGLVVNFLGSAQLTIKGPAAGLIVVAIGAVNELGQGDATLGYRRALAVGILAALVQIALALLRLARVGVAMPPSVVHGMLAAIGVIIVSKQVHAVFGVTPTVSEPLDLLREVPGSVLHENPEIALIGIVSLVILFGVPMMRHSWVRRIPAPMLVLAVTVPLGLLFDLDHEHHYRFAGNEYAVGPQYLVSLPGALVDAIAFPDFSVVFSGTSLKYVVMYALVGSIESTLSVVAVDQLDPAKRASDLNRDLLVVGIGNLISAAIGGLPMISEIVRSKANIDAGATSRWANFFHGGFLLLSVALIPGILHYIPLAALAAMLVYTGVRLAAPRELSHSLTLGADQLFIFVSTLMVTLLTDLLVGVGVGLVLKVLLHMGRGLPWKNLFRAEAEVRRAEDELRIVLHGSATFLTFLRLQPHLQSIPADVERVVIDFGDVRLVDHTFLERLHGMSEEWTAELLLESMDRFQSASEHPRSARWRRAS
ncbi:MAG TPA: SulP family inorganic anion transporter [Polyangiaceae bacterium]|nr:SulP family inorganic anion transporter [Polyangiaceae bacterium]